MKEIDDRIYTVEFVSNLFNSMSKTYGFINYASSFGFTERWRSQFVKFLPQQKEKAIGYDLMTGMGENWSSLKGKIHGSSTIYYVDISEVMLSIAEQKAESFPHYSLIKKPVDALNSNFPDAQADFIVSSFGLKTFSVSQQSKLASEVSRLLKKGGNFSFVEISKPTNLLLKTLFIFYIKFCIPVIGFLFMGNSNDYKMLGIYTTKFNNCQHFYNELKRAGLSVTYEEFFFGCATCVHGTKL